MSNLVAVYSDIHHGNVIGRMGPSGLDIRIEDTIEIEKKITQYCIDNKIDTIIFCGDRFKSRNPSMWLVNLVDKIWLERARKGIKTYCLLGNHDFYKIINLGSSYSDLWEERKDIKIFDKPTEFLSLGLSLGFLPYGYKIEDLENNVDILFFHDEIFGFKDSRGFQSKAGLNKEEIINKCKFFIGGHIHSFEDSFQGKGIYLGAPYQIDALDVGRDRGFIILDLDSLKFEFIIPEGVPRLVKLEVSNEKDLQDVEGNYVYCNVKKGQESKIRAKLEEMNPRWFSITSRKEKGMFVESLAKEIYSGDNLETMIREYVGSREVAGKDSIIDAGIKILGELNEN